MADASPADVTVRTRPRRDEVRARVLDAARDVFAERGFALVDAEVAVRVDAVEHAPAGTDDLPGAPAAVDARTAFVASRRDLRSRVAEVVERLLGTHPVQTGWYAGRLTLVVIALTNGLAPESLPDPEAVPDDLLPRVLADLVDRAP